jgi:protein-disulfide isomerase
MTQLTPAVNSHDHISGNPEAALELVEYGDYECPYCGAAYPIVKDIQERLGKVLRFIFRNFPLSKIHQHAFIAAIATEAAALHNKFWEMHDIVFENQKALEMENILHLAETIGLDSDQFEFDLTEKSLLNKVRKDFESGLRSGVNRTPTFYINGEKFDGDWRSGDLLQYLENQLTII